MTRRTLRVSSIALLWSLAVCGDALPQDELQDFEWRSSDVLVSPRVLAGDEKVSVKDPTIVRHDGRWHLFVTVRGTERSHLVAYLSFEDWQDAADAEPVVLPNHKGFFCAPQVFWFEPHRKWYLVCQASSNDWEPKYSAAFATTDDIGDPKSWSKLRPLADTRTPDGKAGLDFWVICDNEHAYLFYTTLNGRMWRCRTAIGDFPSGWSKPELVLRGDVFEASHTYRLKGDRERYLTIIEAQGEGGRRYFKAYTADGLDGEWTPIAATRERPFASRKNVSFTGERWSDAVSHGELLRTGRDQRLEVDPKELRMIYQGVLDADRRGKPYGRIPWRLGLLTPAERPPSNPE